MHMNLLFSLLLLVRFGLSEQSGRECIAYFYTISILRQKRPVLEGERDEINRVKE